MLIHDLPHGTLGLHQHLRNKEQQDEQYCTLVGQGKRSQCWEWICCKLPIDVIVFHSDDNLLHEFSLDWKSLKQVIRVVLGFDEGSSLGGWPELGVSGQPPHLLDVRDVFSSVVPVVSHNHFFPDRPDDDVIHEEQHDTVEVECLCHELFSLYDFEDVVESVLDVYACPDLVGELNQIAVVEEDG